MKSVSPQLLPGSLILTLRRPAMVHEEEEESEGLGRVEVRPA